MRVSSLNRYTHGNGTPAGPSPTASLAGDSLLRLAFSPPGHPSLVLLLSLATGPLVPLGHTWCLCGNHSQESDTNGRCRSWRAAYDMTCTPRGRHAATEGQKTSHSWYFLQQINPFDLFFSDFTFCGIMRVASAQSIFCKRRASPLTASSWYHVRRIVWI